MASNLWYVGVILEIFVTMSGTMGKQLIRLSEQYKVRRPMSAKFTFRLGLFINTTLGPILDVGAYSFATQSLIAPFGGLDVVWNAAFAPWVLGETLTRGRVAGCLLIVVGTVMAGCFGNHTDQKYTIEIMEEKLICRRVGFYFLVFFVWLLFNRFYLMRKPKGSVLRGIALGFTAGTLAGNMWCLKGAVELVQTSIENEDPEVWSHWLVYLLAFGAVFFALVNVIYMTQGLKEYEALFMITIYEGSMIIAGCITGAVVLLDLDGLENWRIGMYAFSVFTVSAGMFVIFREECRTRTRNSKNAGKGSITTNGSQTGEDFEDRSSQETFETPESLVAFAEAQSSDVNAIGLQQEIITPESICIYTHFEKPGEGSEDFQENDLQNGSLPKYISSVSENLPTGSRVGAHQGVVSDTDLHISGNCQL